MASLEWLNLQFHLGQESAVDTWWVGNSEEVVGLVDYRCSGGDDYQEYSEDGARQRL